MLSSTYLPFFHNYQAYSFYIYNTMCFLVGEVVLLLFGQHEEGVLLLPGEVVLLLLPDGVLILLWRVQILEEVHLLLQAEVLPHKPGIVDLPL